MVAKKLALSLVVFVLLLAVIEGAARLAMPSMAPVFVREGLYENPLPLVTSVGGQPVPLEDLPGGPDRLAEEKAPNELRVAVLGESSVAGAPFDVHCSMPAMLLDELRRGLPDRDVTVINLGRPGSIAANVYYYLVYLRRFSPDVVVFYMGMNDSPFAPGEQCLLGERPALLGAWQGLVESSWAAWLARVWGVQYAWRFNEKRDWYPAKDCAVPTFDLWTAFLTRFARGLGARVVVASPMASPLIEFEYGAWSQPLDISTWTGEQRGLLACALTAGCDLDRLVRDGLDQTDFPLLPDRGYAYHLRLATKELSWHLAALAAGASHVRLAEILSARSPYGVPSTDFFSDWMRLAPKTYLFLARLVAARIQWMLSGQAPASPVAYPTDDDVRPYFDATGKTGMLNVFDQFEFGLALTVTRALQAQLAAFDGPRCERQGTCDEIARARIALAWLKWQVGLDPGVAPERMPEVYQFDPKRRN